MTKRERRQAENYRLRLYFNQIKRVKAMSKEQWLEQWMQSNMQWLPKEDWIAQLEQWALEEARAIVFNKRGAA